MGGRQVKGWSQTRQAIAKYGRAVSTGRLQIAVAGLAVAVAGLVAYVIAGSGLIGSAAVAPTRSTRTPVTASPTPGQHTARPPAHSVAPGSPSPPASPAASSGTVPQSAPAGPQRPSNGGQSGEHERHPRCTKRCKPRKSVRHPTSTTLVAAPSPATVGGQVTLTATETTSSGGHVAGHMHFEAGEAGIGTPVAVNADGVATITTTFAVAGREHLSAEFTPASAAYTGSKGTFSLVVRPVAPNVAGVVLVSVTVPRTGAFTVSIQSGPVQLIPSGSTATGRLPNVTVTDTRNYVPGWSLSGQASRFTYSRTGKSVSGNQLGWVPKVVGSLHDGAQLGHAVAPARPGLGASPATLAYATAGCGFGTNVLSANLTLDIPRTFGGHYTGTVTITYVESLPASSDDDQAACASSGGHKQDT